MIQAKENAEMDWKWAGIDSQVIQHKPNSFMLNCKEKNLAETIKYQQNEENESGFRILALQI